VAETTGISWTDSTFNPWIGCTKVSPACDNCYAEAMMGHRYGRVNWGPGEDRARTGSANWSQPLAWNRKAAATGTRPFVFCASLADVFDNEVDPYWRRDLFALIEATPNLSWLLVTKRIGNVRGMMPSHWVSAGFPDHVRLMITVVNQEEANRDIPKLLALPCKNGISYEPALGPIDFSPWLNTEEERDIDWIIVGGESGQPGHKARPFDVAWAQSTVAQCKAAGVPVFVKQLGANPQAIAYPSDVSESEKSAWMADGWTHIISDRGAHWRKYYRFKDRAGADPAEWPIELLVQEFPA